MSQMRVIKAWILDRSWGTTFMNMTRNISASKSFKTRERPVSWKQLLAKYDEDEIYDLIESGAIVEARNPRPMISQSKSFFV